MFNSQERVKFIVVELILADGRQLNGNLIIAEMSSLLSTLNGDGKFAVFLSHNKEHKLIAKSSIIEANEVFTAPVKALSGCNDNGFDPYQILDVPPQSSRDIITKQYKKLARRYHPGRYTHPEMPSEIAAYALEMSNLIEQAYLSLSPEREFVA